MANRLYMHVLAAGVFLAALPLGDPARAAGPDGYVSLGEGSRWSYAYTRTRTRTVDGIAGKPETFRGALHASVEASERALGPRVVKLQTALRVRRETTLFTEYYSTNGTDLDLHGVRAVGLLGKEWVFTRYSPALRLLRADLEAGASWEVGELESEGLKRRVRGQLMGYQDATGF